MIINNLFSSFDPIGSTICLNYSILLLSLCLPWSLLLFKNQPRNLTFFKTIINFIEQELKATLRRKNQKGKIRILLSFFITILIFNFAGLIPYIFTITAHILITFSRALAFWIGLVLFRIHKNTSHFLSHLVPLRTPLPLSQFIVLIETTRQIIRPLTLAVRLAANITAGHILIALSSSTTTIFNALSLVLLTLFFLEIAVAAIQSYVFTILMAMYLEEAYDNTTSPISYNLPQPLASINRNCCHIFPSCHYLLNKY